MRPGAAAAVLAMLILAGWSGPLRGQQAGASIRILVNPAIQSWLERIYLNIEPTLPSFRRLVKSDGSPSRRKREAAGSNPAGRGRLGKLKHYRFLVADLEDPNAFAMPDGTIVFSRGLLLLVESDDEMAAVMAHELAHVEAGHHPKRSLKQAIWSAISGAAAIIAARGDPAAAFLSSQLFALMMTMSYSRKQELEADRLAVRYLSESGYSPAALRTILEKLQRYEKERMREKGPTYTVSGIFRTHPFWPRRLKVLAKVLAAHPEASREVASTFDPASVLLAPSSRLGTMKERPQEEECEGGTSGPPSPLPIYATKDFEGWSHEGPGNIRRMEGKSGTRLKIWASGKGTLRVRSPWCKDADGGDGAGRLVCELLISPSPPQVILERREREDAPRPVSLPSASSSCVVTRTGVRGVFSRLEWPAEDGGGDFRVCLCFDNRGTWYLHDLRIGSRRRFRPGRLNLLPPTDAAEWTVKGAVVTEAERDRIVLRGQPGRRMVMESSPLKLKASHPYFFSMEFASDARCLVFVSAVEEDGHGGRAGGGRRVRFFVQGSATDRYEELKTILTAPEDLCRIRITVSPRTGKGISAGIRHPMLLPLLKSDLVHRLGSSPRGSEGGTHE